MIFYMNPPGKPSGSPFPHLSSQPRAFVLYPMRLASLSCPDEERVMGCNAGWRRRALFFSFSRYLFKRVQSA